MKLTLWISGVISGLLALLFGAGKAGILPLPDPWDDVCLGLLILFLAVWFVLFWSLRPNSVAPYANVSSTNYAGADLSGIMHMLKEIKEAVHKAATPTTVSTIQTNVANRLTEMEKTLLRAVAAEAVKAMEASELGIVRAKLAECERLLASAKVEEASIKRQVEEGVANYRRLQDEGVSIAQRFEGLAAVKVDLERQLGEFRSALEQQQRLVRDAQVDLEAKKSECESIRAEAAKAYGHLVPASLRESELSHAMAAFFAEAVGGQPGAVFVWSALTAFGAAQADPAAKDFQLQIVRRLGVVLVQYWKQKGLSEKERHEQLSSWAKCLNEHADGRYNLFVPGLGTPIDRTRMACTTSATTVHEVLCWQVRNPAGANFSLAEVA
jgi:hypothetical protein